MSKQHFYSNEAKAMSISERNTLHQVVFNENRQGRCKCGWVLEGEGLAPYELTDEIMEHYKKQRNGHIPD